MNRIAIALAIACACTAIPASAQKIRVPPPCPKGEHHYNVNGHISGGCEKDEAAHSSGSNEESAWNRAASANAAYQQASGAFNLSSQNAESAQRRLQSMNCGQFACDTHEVNGAISSAESGMSNAGNSMQNAIADCEKAKKDVEAAHKAGSNFRSGTPTCPSSGSMPGCPKGYARGGGPKCVKVGK